MSKKWDYGGAFETNPIQAGEVAVWKDGSNVRVNNIFDPVPAEWKEADCIFVDPPWNLGNLNSFYTKADRDDYQESFDPFYQRLFKIIKTVRPAVCYVEIGKEYLADFIIEMRSIYRYVTFYNSSLHGRGRHHQLDRRERAIFLHPGPMHRARPCGHGSSQKWPAVPGRGAQSEATLGSPAAGTRL